MHVTDWAEAQREDPEIEAAMDWCHLNKKKSEPWIGQLTKLKSRLGSHKNTPAGKSLLRNVDKLTLSVGLLYYWHKSKYQLEEVKRLVVPWAHRRTAIDGCHWDASHQGKKRTESLILDQFWWPGVYEDVDRAIKNCRYCQLYGGRGRRRKLPWFQWWWPHPSSWFISILPHLRQPQILMSCPKLKMS